MRVRNAGSASAIAIARASEPAAIESPGCIGDNSVIDIEEARTGVAIVAIGAVGFSSHPHKNRPTPAKRTDLHQLVHRDKLIASAL